MTKRVKNHIESAFVLISAIPVAQDNVERMAQAKEQLRAAFALLKETQETEGAAPEEAKSDG